MAIVFILYLAIIVFLIASMWKIFEKAGRPGWEAIIPIYNLYVLLIIVGKPTWWLILMIIPILNVVFLVWVTNMLSKSFGKDEAFTIGLILLGFVFYPILGFGDAKYLGPYGNPEAFKAYQSRNSFDIEQNRLA